MDDMTLPVLEGMIGYFIDASAYLTGDLPDDEDPHDRRGHVEARQALGRLMLWQGWAPPSGSFASQPFTFATPGMGWGA